MINRTLTLRGLIQFRGFLQAGTNFQLRTSAVSNYNAEQYAVPNPIHNSEVPVPPYLPIGQPSRIIEPRTIPRFQLCLNNTHPSSSSHIVTYGNGNPQPQHQESPTKSSGQSKSPDSGKPSLDQIMNIYNILQDTLPKIFVQPMNYKIYSPDIVFINNISNKTTYGLMKYVQQVALLRTVGHLKFAFVRLEIVSMSQDAEEGRIIVKWRIAGISGLRVMLKFWKYRLWKWAEIMKQQETWYDGISYYDVGADGLIFRHIVDKVEEDKDRVVESKRDTNTLQPKLAMMNPTSAPMNSFQSVYFTAGKKYRKYVDSEVNSRRPKRLSYV